MYEVYYLQKLYKFDIKNDYGIKGASLLVNFTMLHDSSNVYRALRRSGLLTKSINFSYEYRKWYRLFYTKDSSELALSIRIRGLREENAWLDRINGKEEKKYKKEDMVSGFFGTYHFGHGLKFRFGLKGHPLVYSYVYLVDKYGKKNSYRINYESQKFFTFFYFLGLDPLSFLLEFYLRFGGGLEVIPGNIIETNPSGVSKYVRHYVSEHYRNIVRFRKKKN